ncbi:MAG: hypothetical protein PHY48_06080 [Candidatus Cloacimonetes bacterium]|nr:hypothetical protein [Candidatus Cloacimonadota bacterium]
MKGVVLLILVLVLCTGISAQVRTCREIQETTLANGDSPYMDQMVQVRGIVTAIKRGSGFFIGDALAAGDDGRWSGLSVSDPTLSDAVQLGDIYILSGTVKEVSGVTKLMLLTANQMESSGNPIPISQITTTQLPYDDSTISEAWEGVMVRFSDVKIMTLPSLYFNILEIADANNPVTNAKVDDFLYPYSTSQFVVGDTWYQIQGVVDYSATDKYRVFPRSVADLVKIDNIEASKISIKSASGSLNSVTSLEVKTTKLKTEWNVTKYSLVLNIDASIVRFNGVDISGTLTPTMPTYTVVGNVVTITYDGAQLEAAGETTLIKLLLEPQTYGVVPIEISSFSYNDIAMTAFENGNLSVVLANFVAYMNIGTASSDKNIFDPMVEKIKIEYGTKGGFLARTIIRIYDAQGRVVATPLNKNFTGLTTVQQIDSFEWNGRDGSMNLLPPGLYYCNMEVANRQNGAIARSVQPIVIKSRLK